MGQARKEIAGCWKRLYATLNVGDSLGWAATMTTSGRVASRDDVTPG